MKQSSPQPIFKQEPQLVQQVQQVPVNFQPNPYLSFYNNQKMSIDPSMLAAEDWRVGGGVGFEQMNLQDIHSPLSPNDIEFAGSLTSPFDTPSLYSNSIPINSSFSAPTFGSYGTSPITISSQSIPENSVPETGDLRSVEAIEKRRKRRESHNAVERRRRDHINEKIQELSALLPEFASDATNKPNKGVVLRRSVEYIRHMQLFAARQMDRTLELEQVLMRVCQTRGIEESELGLTMPLGTPIQLPALQQHSSQDLEEDD